MSDAKIPLPRPALESLDIPILLRPVSANSVDPLQQAQALAARSRRLCTLLAAVTALSWGIACVAAIWTAEVYFNEIRKLQPLRDYRYAQKHEEIQGIAAEQLSEDQRREIGARQRVVERADEFMMLLAQTTIVLFGIAALLSVWLTIASRRVALRQVNANLLAITTELRKLLPIEPSPA